LRGGESDDPVAELAIEVEDDQYGDLADRYSDDEDEPFRRIG